MSPSHVDSTVPVSNGDASNLCSHPENGSNDSPSFFHSERAVQELIQQPIQGSDDHLIEFSEALITVAKALRRAAEGKALAQAEAAEWKRRYELEKSRNLQLQHKGCLEHGICSHEVLQDGECDSGSDGVHNKMTRKDSTDKSSASAASSSQAASTSHPASSQPSAASEDSTEEYNFDDIDLSDGVSKEFLEGYNSRPGSKQHDEAMKVFNQNPPALAVRLFNSFQTKPELRLMIGWVFRDLFKIRDVVNPKLCEALKPHLLRCLRLDDEEGYSFEYMLPVFRTICRGLSPNFAWEEIKDFICRVMEIEFVEACDLYLQLPTIEGNEFLEELSLAVFETVLGGLDIWQRTGGDKQKLFSWDLYWILAFKAAFKIGVQLVGSPDPTRCNETNKLLAAMKSSASEIVRAGCESMLKEVLSDLTCLVEEEAGNYSEKQKEFVSTVIQRS